MMLRSILLPLLFGVFVVGFNYVGRPDDKSSALDGLVKNEYNKYIDVYVDSTKVIQIETGAKDDVRLGITIVHFKEGITLGGQPYDFFSGVLLVNCTKNTYSVLDAAFTEMNHRVPDLEIKDTEIYSATNASPSSRQVEMLCSMKITDKHSKTPHARRLST